jgi:hypothetical protein
MLFWIWDGMFFVLSCCEMPITLLLFSAPKQEGRLIVVLGDGITQLLIGSFLFPLLKICPHASRIFFSKACFSFQEDSNFS